MKNIHIFLPLENNNIKIAEITRGGIYAISLPRNAIKTINSLEPLADYKLDSLKTAGVYFLIGENNEIDDTLDVYIGKAEDCLARINQHNDKDEKDFQKIIVITSNKEDYNLGHITYLEHHLDLTAKKANRCNLTNANTPPTTKISPEIKADLDLDIKCIKTLMEVFNFNILVSKKIKTQTVISDVSTDKEESETFYCKSQQGGDASALYYDNEGRILVFKGSKVRKDTTDSCQTYIIKIRNNLITEGILLEENNNYIFKQDYEFKSPSTASAVVLGRSSNGLLEWKNNSNKTLKDIYLV